MRSICAGGVTIGDGAPVSVQSMTNTATSDIETCVIQINALDAAGCDIVRVAVPDMESAEAISEIKRRTSIPIVADIHFDYKLAVRAVDCGADKIRINPGNIGGIDAVRAVAESCAKHKIPIRVGVNSGSVSRAVISKHGGVTPEAMFESAMGNVKLLNSCGFDDICLSVKCSSVPLTVQSYKLLRSRTDYPLHIGVTETGTEYMGTIKSAAGIGALLSDGIGDTIRVSLSAPPEREVQAGIAILKALGLRRGYELISCPTCGRTKIDLIPLATEVERRLEVLGRDISVAVMGCVVNGPGEASRADYGIAGGDKEGLIFKKGKIIAKVTMDNLVTKLFEVINEG